MPLRRATVWICLLALAPRLLAGCNFMPVGDSPFADGTRWQVVALDGTDLSAMNIHLDFQPEGSQAALVTGCPQAKMPVTHNTGAGAIGFGPDDFATRGTPVCEAEAMETFRRLLDAFAGVERWERDGTRFDLLGTHRIRLMPAGEATPTKL